MHTLNYISRGLKTVPAATSWYLADISEAKGKQDLFTLQSPQKLKVLREHALVESAISSNRLEGVELDKKRIGTVIFGRPMLVDRNEEEVQGYLNALEWVHKDNDKIKLNETAVRKLHKLSRGIIWDAGKYKDKDGDIIERLPNGETLLRFRTVSAKKTPFFMKESLRIYHDILKNQASLPILPVLAFNFDFLCIHPFRDGNGRVSRLLLLLQLYHAGFQVGRYISLERLIEENKERYYETLKESSIDWHKGRHNPWPYINFMLYIVKSAYKEFMERIDSVNLKRGDKTQFVIQQIETFGKTFTLAQLHAACPAVSKDLIRNVIRDLRKAGSITSLGRGPGAKWSKKGNTLKKG